MSDAVYEELFLKSLFFFADKGFEFAPAQARLDAVSPRDRPATLMQQKMRFEPTTPLPMGLRSLDFVFFIFSRIEDRWSGCFRW